MNFVFLLQIAFVITDGQQTTTRGPYTPLGIASQGLKDLGVAVYCMGIGAAVDLVELRAMASSPDYIFQPKNFEALDLEVEKIRSKLCEGTFI